MARPAPPPRSVRLFGYVLFGVGLVVFGVLLPLLRDDVPLGDLVGVVVAGVLIGGVVTALLAGRPRQIATLAVVVVGLAVVLGFEKDLAGAWMFAAMLGIQVGIDLSDARSAR